MNKIGQLIIGVAVASACFIDSSAAQFTSTLGTSTLTGQRYDCVSYPGGEDILIVPKNGKSQKVSKKKAINKLKNAARAAAQRIATLKRSLKEKNKRIQKLLNSPTLALPKVAAELERLKREVPALEALIESTAAQKTEFSFLISAVGNCGKEPPPLVGTNIIVTYSLILPKTGWQAYGIHAVHAFAVPIGVPDRICVSVNDGPYYLQGIRYSVGTTFYDGSGRSNPVSHSEPAPLQTGYLPFFGKASYFHLGRYEDDSAEVQSKLGMSFKLFIPSAKKSCPAP